MKARVDALKKHLELFPHPEGGYYKETYRSSGVVKNPYPDAQERNFATAIYFLLVSGNFSAFHRIKQDEIWHFYEGAAIHLHVLDSEGKYELIKIGTDLFNGEVPQYMVKAGDWFASEVSVENSYSLAGCTVSPGFDFADFEMAKTAQLTEQYPEHKLIIDRLTRD